MIEGDSATGSVARDIVYTDTGAAGVYTVTETDAAGIDLGTTRFVVNAGHQRESDLRVDPNLASALATASGSGVDVLSGRSASISGRCSPSSPCWSSSPNG